MAGSSNLNQWNPNAANQESDSTYAGDSQRAGGAVDGQYWDSVLANKILYQLSTIICALGQSLAGKGITLSDGTTPYTPVSTSNAAVVAAASALNNFLTSAASDGVTHEVAWLEYGPAAVVSSQPLWQINTASTTFSISTLGYYRLSWYAVIDAAGGTSSTMGPITFTFVDGDNISQTVTLAATSAAGAVETSNSSNTRGSVLCGIPFFFSANVCTPELTLGYTNGGSPNMKYLIWFKLEQIPY